MVLLATVGWNLPRKRGEQKHWRALSDQLPRFAAEQPVLLILEDAHWIDPSTLEHAPCPEPSWPRWRRSHHQVLGGQKLSSDTVDTIIARTDGVPLFVEELTKAVMETGDTVIPASLYDSLVARLDRLPASKRSPRRQEV
jgi:predicted ATPase